MPERKEPISTNDLSKYQGDGNGPNVVITPDGKLAQLDGMIGNEDHRNAEEVLEDVE